MNKPPIILLQLAIADYRDCFMRSLIDSIPGIEVQVGERYFEPSTRTSDAVLALPRVQLIRNHYFFGILAWQSLHWRAVIAADVIVAELNPRVLSNWCVLIIRRAIGRPTLLWGHAWPRSGPSSRTERLRHVMRRLASGLVLYTESQKRELVRRHGQPESIFVAPNALYSAREMYASSAEARDFIYVGRMIRAKKVDLLVQAFQEFVPQAPDAHLHLVGTGEELGSLQRLVEEQSIPNVVFHGHVADPDRLRALYRSCVAAVSPGYVGLSITQSFSFGVPMIIARDEPHSPEIECAVEDVNCRFFESDSFASLAEQMRYLYAHLESRLTLSESIVADCKARYSVERMVAGFRSAFEAQR